MIPAGMDGSEKILNLILKPIDCEHKRIKITERDCQITSNNFKVFSYRLSGFRQNIFLLLVRENSWRCREE